MSLIAFLLSVLVFWLVVYAIRESQAGHLSPGFLPTFSTSTSVGSRGTASIGFREWKTTLQNFHLSAQTTSLNIYHDALSDFLAKPSSANARNVLTLFYNIGAVASTFGMTFGLIALFYISYGFADSSFQHTDNHRTKRDASHSFDPPRSLGLKFLVPGVTVPWSHLPLLLVALFAAQSFHETGHAVAAAIDAVPLHSVGASLTLILPSAFVSLSPSLASSTSSARLRIIGAGAWHNLALWALLCLASFAGAHKLWRLVGWADVSERGLVVTGIEAGSALAYHLTPGSVITALDDVRLASEYAWTCYLLSDHRSHHPPEVGWCTAASEFYGQSSDCCTARTKDAHPPAAPLSCFIPLQGGDGHCLDPVPIMASNLHSHGKPERCRSVQDCGPMMECVVPDADEQLLRISIEPPIWSKEEHGVQLLWSGPWREVWEQVDISTLSPRSRYLPLWLPDAVSLFFKYLSTLSFSLYIFNLFVLPFIDGSHFLSALLDNVGGNTLDSPSSDVVALESRNTEGRSTPDIEAGRPSSAARTLLFVRRQGWKLSRRLKSRIERAVKMTTIALMTIVIIGTIVSGL